MPPSWAGLFTLDTFVRTHNLLRWKHSPTWRTKWWKLAMAGWIAAAVVAANIIGGKQQQSASSKIVDRQHSFQQFMSSTAYQRAMTDMRAAGLNPILAYKQGGASTTMGASFQAQNVVGSAAKAGADVYASSSQARSLQASTAVQVQDERIRRLDADKKAQGGDNAIISAVIDAKRAGSAAVKQIKRKGVKTQKLPPRYRPRHKGVPKQYRLGPAKKSFMQRLKTPSPWERSLPR